jgi:xanthine dehydrogenase large subunit
MINRGQIIGAFIQGQGWLTTEDLRYSSQGALLSYSPTTYKIPNIYDTPPILNLSVIESDCTVNVRGTKAVGEPPLVLGVATWTAVKNALSYVSGDEIATLSTPASGEEILSRLTYYASSNKEQEQLSKKDSPVLARTMSKAMGTAVRGKSPKVMAAGKR